jgi:hypothetical protein
MEGYQEILKSFETRDILNGEIWNDVFTDNPKLKPQIRKVLLKIASEFQGYLGDNIFISDVRFTGSLANYNWSKFSDIDLHCIIDFEQFDPSERELYKELFNLKKTLFNENHNIRVKGYEVELYAEDITEKHVSSGVYSVLFNDWVHQPIKKKINLDKKFFLKKADTMMDRIDNLMIDVKDLDIDTALKKIKDFNDKLKKYRKSGLDKGGELSYENMIFKFLRRNGYLEKLFTFKNELMDRKLSL